MFKILEALFGFDLNVRVEKCIDYQIDLQNPDNNFLKIYKTVLRI